jgi:hypothetical protein
MKAAKSSNRRNFLKSSAAAGITFTMVRSLEEYALATAAETPPAAPAGAPGITPALKLPGGKIGNVTLSRLICGGNLVSGFAHSRDLIYVSPLLKHYFTDEKIIATWAGCEFHGINAMILNPEDARAVKLYEKHRSQGGKIQYLAQVAPAKGDLKTPVKQAKDSGAVGAFLLGNLGDAWTREGDTARIGELLQIIKEEGMIAGVAGHELRTIKEVEKARLAPDFYMKTLHDTNYWSKRRPDQEKEVIDNYSIDNYWCMDPKETIAYMSELNRPWIAYKVLAAGAIHPRVGFRHAFDNGADYVAVGMFDFQISEDAAALAQAVNDARNREREWMGGMLA